MWKYNETNNLPSTEIYHSADELYHYGVLGMKWKHHKARLAEYDKEYERRANKILNTSKNHREINRKMTNLDNELNKKYADSIQYKMKRDKRIKALKIAGVAAVATVAAIKIRKTIKDKNANAAKAREACKNLNNLMKSSSFDGRKIINVTSKSQIPKTAVKFDPNNRDHMYDLIFGG